jgi:flagellar basal-body rod protein FlgB
MKNQILSQNIANVDTPGYKRKDVTFAEELERMMRQDDFDKKDVEAVKVKVFEDNNKLSYRMDGNNVDIDVEMVRLAQNQLKYNTFTQLSGFNSIKTVLEV